MSRAVYTQTQDPGYFDAERWDMLAELPPPYGRVLDVGCGAGATGRRLRQDGAELLVGIEPNAAAAAAAREVFDTVQEGTVENVLAEAAVEGPFDAILLYDVLEHLVDPAHVLRALRELAAPDARIHISVPNARHWSLVRDLALRGTFGYTEWGHRDATHLRWFAPRDLEQLVTASGYGVERSGSRVFGRSALIDRATFGLLRQFLALQWHVLARPA
ncbi:MAG TPA: class I SAM-dependent methyltransferase [Thermoleophilaceae bacterium]